VPGQSVKAQKHWVTCLPSVAFSVAHSRNKYTAEAASMSAKPWALGNCFLSAIFDTWRTFLKNITEHFVECYLTLGDDLHRIYKCLLSSLAYYSNFYKNLLSSMQIWHILAYFKPGFQLVILGRITGSLFLIFGKN
jgi:hypothetical protein